MNEQLIASIVEDVLREMMEKGLRETPADPGENREEESGQRPGGDRGENGLRPGSDRGENGQWPGSSPEPAILRDITSREEKSKPTLEHPMDPEALQRMMSKTTARIGVGKAGPRERTKTWLTLRADHALARDAVFSDVDEELIAGMKLVSVCSCCSDRTEHITRPDLGRKLNEEGKRKVLSACAQGPDVQLIASDGLSSKAIEANLENILPVIEDGLKMRQISTGPAIFVKFGRVAVEDEISEILHPKVVCILIGERPGLGTAESMSAYICYRAYNGQPEARRTVVSNIYSGGTNAVEAGAYVAELIETIIKAGASGVDLKH